LVLEGKSYTGILIPYSLYYSMNQAAT